MNSVNLIGNLVRDVDLRFTKGGMAVGNFTIAVSRNGSKDKTDFISVKVFSTVAENCAKYLSKGSKVGIGGIIQSSNYEKDGVKKYVFDVIGNRVEFLNTKSSGSSVVIEDKNDLGDFANIEDDDEIPF